MKKTLVVYAVVFLIAVLSVSIVFAEAGGQISQLTLAKDFNWEMDYDDVVNYLKEHPYRGESLLYENMIVTSLYGKDHITVISFLFVLETHQMVYITADKTIYSKNNGYQALHTISGLYHLKDMEEYSDEILDFELKEFDKKVLVADSDMIYVLGASENYQNSGFSSCGFFIANRQIWENANPFVK